MKTQDVAQFRQSLDYLSLTELKGLYHSVIIADDECGIEIIRPDEERQQMILERTAQLIAEEDSDHQKSGEREPDFFGAAKDFLTRN